MDTTRARRLGATQALLLALLALFAALLAACGSSGKATAQGTKPAAAPAGSETASQAALHTAMRSLWEQHMEWTYATIAAFAANSKGLNDTLNRLLQDQVDIGNAIKPYYGEAAGQQLTSLLKTHILDFVPILKAAKAGDQRALKPAETAVYANAKQIGDFLAKANPKNWPQSTMEQMMKTHIDQTLAYGTAQLQGNYADSIKVYGQAENHMLMMADVLSKGIIAQFPGRFAN